jgi:uncharacterized protein YjbJ (UPF0337 family)
MLGDRIEGSIKNGVGHLQDGAGGLAGDLPLQAKGKLNEAAGFVQDLVGQAKGHLADAVDTAKDRSSGSIETVRALVQNSLTRNEDRYDEIKALVVKNPLAAVGVAAAVGILFGLFLKRSSR